MKDISLRKYIDLLRSEIHKIILDVTTPSFQLVCGVTQPLIFNKRQNIFSWYHINHYKINWFLLWRCSNYFVYYRFKLK